MSKNTRSTIAVKSTFCRGAFGPCAGRGLIINGCHSCCCFEVKCDLDMGVAVLPGAATVILNHYRFKKIIGYLKQSRIGRVNWQLTGLPLRSAGIQQGILSLLRLP